MRMTNLNRDILRDTPQLKVTPFDVPDGYFDNLKQNLKSAQTPNASPVVPWIQVMTYTALAAAGALLITVGGFFLEGSSDSDFTEEDYIVFSGSPTDIFYYDDDEYFAEAETIDNDDIAEYLIYIGASVESIESEE